MFEKFQVVTETNHGATVREFEAKCLWELVSKLTDDGVRPIRNLSLVRGVKSDV